MKNIIQTIKELWAVLFGRFDVDFDNLKDWSPTQEEVDEELFNMPNNLTKKDDFALELSSRWACTQTDDFGESLILTAKCYKKMTGVDLGIKDLEQTQKEIIKKKKKV